MALQHASPAMQDNDEVVFLRCKTVVFRRCLQLLQSGVVDERWKDVGVVGPQAILVSLERNLCIFCCCFQGRNISCRQARFDTQSGLYLDFIFWGLVSTSGNEWK